MRSQLRLRRVDLIKQKLEEFYTPMLALLTQNGALFRSFGPHTFPNAPHRREAAAQVWNELRSKIILPNNELMLKILAEKSHLISQLDSYDNYVPLQNHIIMYKIFCENPNEVYDSFKFPNGIAALNSGSHSKGTNGIQGCLQSREAPVLRSVPSGSHQRICIRLGM